MRNKLTIIVQIEAIISNGIERVNNKNRKNEALNPAKISHITEVILQYPILYNRGNNKTIANKQNDKIVNIKLPKNKL